MFIKFFFVNHNINLIFYNIIKTFLNILYEKYWFYLELFPLVSIHFYLLIYSAFFKIRIHHEFLVFQYFFHCIKENNLEVVNLKKNI